MAMIVSCEECGKKYRVDTDKIKGDRATFTCKACGNPIIVHKPTPMAEEHLEPITPTPTPEEARPTEPPKEEPAKAEAPKVHRLRLKGMGLRGKLMTFLLIPLILALAIGAFFSLRQIVSLSGLITGESSKMVTQMAEKEISS
ncbi:zinc-ribbon domain-containing protein, partial [bacterium]|nr:zinc-ribbon domain-containing protein [bacterium]